jgi:tetrahydromethanopterin S-methyltransferase subunit G
MLAEEGGIQLTAMGTKPSWVEDVDAVEENLQEIQRQMDQLQSMHAQRVGSVFGKDLEDMEGRIEGLTARITDKFRVCERLLQKVGMATRRAGGQEATIGANVQRRCVREQVAAYLLCWSEKSQWTPRGKPGGIMFRPPFASAI